MTTVSDKRDSVSVGRAIADNRALFILPMIILLGAAIAYGVLRSPTYTATAQVTVGGTDLTRPPVLANDGAAESLSAVFSRALTADAVTESTAAELGIDVSGVRNQLSGVPIPNTNLFVINAESDAESGAIKLANVASSSLISYITRLNTAHRDRIQDQLERAILDRADQQATANESPAEEAAAAAQVAKLRVDSLEAAYRVSLSSETQVLQSFDEADTASDDQAAKLQLFVFIGLAAGLIIGTALALWRARSDALLGL